MLKIKSQVDLDLEDSIGKVSKILQDIMPEKVKAVVLSNASLKNPEQERWSETLYLKECKYQSGTKADKQVANILLTFAGIAISGLVFAMCTYKPSPTQTASTRTDQNNSELEVSSSNAPAPTNFSMNENAAYEVCRQQFFQQLDLPYNTPIYALTEDLTSLVINRKNPNSGTYTVLPDGRTFLAGQALVEENDSETKTRHFICTLNTSDGSLLDFSRGENSFWQ